MGLDVGLGLRLGLGFGLGLGLGLCLGLRLGLGFVLGLGLGFGLGLGLVHVQGGIVINKLKHLQEQGYSLAKIERLAGIGHGVLYKVMKCGKWSKRTERKLDEFLVRRACTYLEISIGEKDG